VEWRHAWRRGSEASYRFGSNISGRPAPRQFGGSGGVNEPGPSMKGDYNEKKMEWV